MKIDRRTPKYMVREKAKQEKIRTRLGRKTMGYKEKLKKGGRNKWATKCWKTVRRREKGEDSKWEKQRRGFYRKRERGNCGMGGGRGRKAEK